MVKMTDIAYVRFQVSDLDRQEEFLRDFGMVPSARTDHALYMRGTGSDHTIYIAQQGDEPKFLGFAMQAPSQEALDQFAADNELPVRTRDEPGGGFTCSLTDPNGYDIEVVTGIEDVTTLDKRYDAAVNTGKSMGRPNEPVRHETGPSRVIRLGHIAIDVMNFHESFAWYNEKFGLIKSDEVFIGEEPVDEAVFGGFTRCDCGDKPVDHHTIFLVGVGKTGFGHAAYEVENLDDLMIGRHVLAEKDYTPVWGVGRHYLGSQIFDYWKDPNGFVLEHWTDGDLYDSTVPAKKNSLDMLAGNQWGPSAPPAMAE